MKYWEIMEAAKTINNVVRYQWLAVKKPRQKGVKFLIELGRLWPTTKEQMKYFVRSGYCLNVLGLKDVCNIEFILNKYGMTGDYKFTKNKNWVRLENNGDLRECMRKELKSTYTGV